MSVGGSDGADDDRRKKNVTIYKMLKVNGCWKKSKNDDDSLDTNYRILPLGKRLHEERCQLNSCMSTRQERMIQLLMCSLGQLHERMQSEYSSEMNIQVMLYVFIVMR